jgi:hypothetical protein
MTLNTTSGISPSSHLHVNAEANSPRRRNTVDSPTSAAFKPATIALPQVSPAIQHQFLPLLSAAQQPSPLHLSPAPGGNARYRSKSPSHHKAVSPHRRRQPSRSPERGNEQQILGPGCGGWLGNGRKNDRQYHLNPKSGPFNMQGKSNNVVQHSIAGQRQSFRNCPQSMSLPSTPNHHARHMTNGVSRSPSPPTMLDSPRSAASEPVTASPYPKNSAAGCLFETLLIDAKRRMPYSLGIDKLKPEKPLLEKLPQAREEALSREIAEEFERLKPSIESEDRRRKFLDKLSRILNEEWPGHDTKVHAFGSTENHLCMNDSDGIKFLASLFSLYSLFVVDVCITTRCKAIESTCKLAAALEKRRSSKQPI